MKVRRRRCHMYELRRGPPDPGVWKEVRERGHQRVEGMRQHIEQLFAEGGRSRSVRVEAWWSKCEIAVHEHRGLQRGRALQQSAERGIANQLMTGTEQQPAVASQSEERFGIAPRFHERLLDVDVGAGEERLAGEVEVRC